MRELPEAHLTGGRGGEWEVGTQYPTRGKGFAHPGGAEGMEVGGREGSAGLNEANGS